VVDSGVSEVVVDSGVSEVVVASTTSVVVVASVVASGLSVVVASAVSVGLESSPVTVTQMVLCGCTVVTVVDVYKLVTVVSAP
jgi:hypothetical protein